MTPPNDERNLLFSNAEEEIFLPECDLVLTITEDGESSRAFSTINQVPFVQWLLSVPEISGYEWVPARTGVNPTKLFCS